MPYGKIAEKRKFKVRDYNRFSDALESYLSQIGGPAGCVGGAISAAGPVIEGRVQLTNAHWHLSENELSQLLGGVPASLLNDLQAVALCLPLRDLPRDAVQITRLVEDYHRNRAVQSKAIRSAWRRTYSYHRWQSRLRDLMQEILAG